MLHFTQAFGAISSKLRAFQPIVSNASRAARLLCVADFPLFKCRVSPGVALLHPASLFALRSFHTLRGCIPSSRVPSSSDTRRRFRSDKERLFNVHIGHPWLDGAFLYGFADSSILKSFLNTVLELNGSQAIEEIQYLPYQDIFQTRPYYPSDPVWHFTLDVRCRTKSGSQVLIEIENNYRSEWDLKARIEHSRKLSLLDTDQNTEQRSGRAPDNYNDKSTYWKKVEKLYTIVITNNKSVDFSILSQSHYFGATVVQPFLVNPCELRHVRQSDRRFGEIPNQIVFLMLDKLSLPHPGQSLTPVERWAHVLWDPALRSGVWRIPTTKDIKDVEALAGDVNDIFAFIDRLNVINLPKYVTDQYAYSVNKHNQSIDALEENIREQRMKRTALRMKNAGKSSSEIASSMGLSVQDVENLLSPD